jgi:hypothetical protein
VPLTLGEDSAPAVTRTGARGALARVVLPFPLEGVVGVGLMLVWAYHDGGYNNDTWYWGALLALAGCGISASLRRRTWSRLSAAQRIALGSMAVYTAWSYASIAWAASPGTALNGSNRTLLYMVLFALMAIAPWDARTLRNALIAYALGIGVIGLSLLTRIAGSDGTNALILEGRLYSPVGYFNGVAALFTMTALVGVALAARRELNPVLRGVLVAIAAQSLALALLGQSRGWLFTLPVVLVIACALAPQRLRAIPYAVLAAVGVLAPLKRLLDVYQTANRNTPITHVAASAAALTLLCAGLILIAGTLLALGEELVRPRPLSTRARRALGSSVALVAVLAAFAGGIAATHGHPLRFVKRQWQGFSHEATAASSRAGSHFGVVGSGRYDFWRVSVDAWLSHPIGGLGQDNFANYYITRRRTDETPAWPHSLELRVLAMTGTVGAVLIVAFLAAALTAALSRRRARADAQLAAIGRVALLPLVVWLVHGSVDWFWELPALSGPALGFLAAAGAGGGAVALRGAVASGDAAPGGNGERSGRRRAHRAGGSRMAARLGLAATLVAGAGAAVVLAFCYLSVREDSIASNLRSSDPGAALAHVQSAARLDPLSSDPGRLGGVIALQAGLYVQAQHFFEQAVARDPGGWFGWFGAGIAASALGQTALARHDLRVARAIDDTQPVIGEALARVDSTHPLTPLQALRGVVEVS